MRIHVIYDDENSFNNEIEGKAMHINTNNYRYDHFNEDTNLKHITYEHLEFKCWLFILHSSTIIPGMTMILRQTVTRRFYFKAFYSDRT